MTATQGQPVDGDDAGGPTGGNDETPGREAGGVRAGATRRRPAGPAGAGAARGEPAGEGGDVREPPARAAARRPSAGPGTGTRRQPDAGDDAVPRGAAARGDTVASVVRQWQAVRPELDTGPMEIIGRVNRCAALLQQAEDAPLRRAGLTRAEFDLLGALRRTDHELTPGELVRETFSSGAAVTKRVKHLTERGLVERRGDARDRRVAHLRLTEAGRALVDGIMPEQLAYESAVLSALDVDRQGELAVLLGELLSRLEGHMQALRI